MTKRDNYLAQYYERATFDQLEDEYKQLGYIVQREVRLDKYRIDMVAERDGHSLFFEVKRSKMDVEARRRLEKLEEIIQAKPNSRLILVPVRYSEEKQISFDNIEEIIYNHFIGEIPDDLDELSSHTRIDSVDYVTLNTIKIYGLDIVVKCSGQVSVELQYGNDSEQERQDNMRMSFPFEFEGTVSWDMDNNNFIVSEVDSLRINTDEYYR